MIYVGTIWPPGVYTYQMCVECRDVDGNGVNDLACEQTTVVVNGGVSLPHITELDGNQDGLILAVNEASFTINTPANGEDYSISVLPDDGFVTVNISNNLVTLTHLPTSPEYQGNCMYDITYTITNGGCVERTTVEVTFTNPWDPDNDGIIQGVINYCPSCGNFLHLNGDRPGCDGIGTWELVSGPGPVFIDNSAPDLGDAYATVSIPGTYTFLYTASNIDPYPTSTYELTCTVLDVDQFHLGPEKTYTYCNNTLEVGSYPVSFNDLPEALYAWTQPITNLGVQIVPADSNAANIIVPNDLDLGINGLNIKVDAYRFYLDDDCGGPNPPVLIQLPFNDPLENWAYVNNLFDEPQNCISVCTTTSYVHFWGAPTVEIESEDINFLCSSGTESIRLKDFFEVTNGVPYAANITVLNQPGSGLPNNVSEHEWLLLNTENGCGNYRFQIDVIAGNYSVFPPVLCTTRVFLNIYIETVKQVTAGTDQIHCPNDLIRLNGNQPFCYAQGAWTQVNCNPCLVEFLFPNDANSSINLNGTPLPDTLAFEWSFTSQDATCSLADTTYVYVDACCGICDINPHIRSECKGDELMLYIEDASIGLLDTSLYSINWISHPGLSGNIVSINTQGSSVQYEAEVAYVTPSGSCCRFNLSGEADCNIPFACDVRVEESCDDCGNVVLSLVDINGNLVKYAPFVHEFAWTIYGGGQNDPTGVNYPKVNPVVMPQNGCYSLQYKHYIYAPNTPMLPGLAMDICKVDFPKTCSSASCPGPCENFAHFFIAACGDDMADSLQLSFPSPCYNACLSASGSTPVTIGVFNTLDYSPLDPEKYLVVWENGAQGTYASGQLSGINSVTVSDKTNACCVWSDAYLPSCLCQMQPVSLDCQQPITKYCKPNGVVEYVPGQAQIAWYGISGASKYVIEQRFDGSNTCCAFNQGNLLRYDTVSSSPWIIPFGDDCFSVRVKALGIEIEPCAESDWSEYYDYCALEKSCSPVIIVCGCCHGDRDADTNGLPMHIMSESDLLEYLEAFPGKGYSSLTEALNSFGFLQAGKSTMQLYPNPANDELVLALGKMEHGIFNIQVHDLLQREWRNETHEIYGEYILSVSDLDTGLYLITVRNLSGELLFSEKLAIVR